MPVGVEYDVTPCDLGVFVDQAAEIAQQADWADLLVSGLSALAQGDGGEQRGDCEQRGRQVQCIVQRAGEGRVPRLDDLVQRPVSG